MAASFESPTDLLTAYLERRVQLEQARIALEREFEQRRATLEVEQLHLEATCGDEVQRALAAQGGRWEAGGHTLRLEPSREGLRVSDEGQLTVWLETNAPELLSRRIALGALLHRFALEGDRVRDRHTGALLDLPAGLERQRRTARVVLTLA